MRNRTSVIAYSLFLLGALVVPASAGQDDAELKKDLTAVIALHGMPCGEVVTVTTQAEKDYAAGCKDGNKYRVYENAQGRVIVEKRQ